MNLDGENVYKKLYTSKRSIANYFSFETILYCLNNQHNLEI
jgi:hypothetical protein